MIKRAFDSRPVFFFGQNLVVAVSGILTFWFQWKLGKWMPFLEHGEDPDRNVRHIGRPTNQIFARPSRPSELAHGCAARPASGHVNAAMRPRKQQDSGPADTTTIKRLQLYPLKKKKRSQLYDLCLRQTRRPYRPFFLLFKQKAKPNRPIQTQFRRHLACSSTPKARATQLHR